MLRQSDQTILPISLRNNEGFHIFCDWYLKPPGALEGFRPLPWQYAWHKPVLPSVTLVAGIAVGKSKIASASILCDFLTIPYFKGLITSVTSAQAEIMYNMMMEWAIGNERVSKLIDWDNSHKKPWPVLSSKIGGQIEARTAGFTGKFLRGFEYDRAVLDEAGLDLSGDVIGILRGRLRGKRPDGTKRMCRLDAITSPTEAEWLRIRFDKGDWKHNPDQYDPRYLSFRIRTRENIHLTEEQIAAIEADYTDEQRAVEMDAEWPNYGLAMFPGSHIKACTSFEMADILYEKTHEIDKPEPGWILEEHPRHGVTHMEMPRDPRGVYVISGDPGRDGPPRRNAGCVMIFDVSKKPKRLVYFHWVDGQGSYQPFVNSYKYAINKYDPLIKVLDTTGTQSMMQEFAFEREGIITDGINFGRDKPAMLNAASLGITNHEFVWPYIKGMDKQLRTYSKDLDTEKSDLPQDIVMTLAMGAFASRYIDSEGAPDVKHQQVQPVSTRSQQARRRRR